jgi:hypothetical protein
MVVLCPLHIHHTKGKGGAAQSHAQREGYVREGMGGREGGGKGVSKEGEKGVERTTDNLLASFREIANVTAGQNNGKCVR